MQDDGKNIFKIFANANEKYNVRKRTEATLLDIESTTKQNETVLTSHNDDVAYFKPETQNTNHQENDFKSQEPIIKTQILCTPNQGSTVKVELREEQSDNETIHSRLSPHSDHGQIQLPTPQSVFDNNAKEFQHCRDMTSTEVRVKVDDLDDNPNVCQHFLKEYQEGNKFLHLIDIETH